MSRSSEWSFLSGFPTKTLYAFFISPGRAICPLHHIFLDLVTLTIFGKEYKLIQYSDLATRWTTGVRFPAGARTFSLRHRVSTGSEVHPASYQMDTEGSVLGFKAVGARS
jgi:hypothetical protein